MVAVEVDEYVCGGGALTHGDALSTGVVVGAPDLPRRWGADGDSAYTLTNVGGNFRESTHFLLTVLFLAHAGTRNKPRTSPHTLAKAA